MKLKFSTVTEFYEEYHKNVIRNKIKFPVIQHDFFPYADNEDSYWTGHFTTLPNLKQKIRQGAAQLFATEQLMSFARVMDTKGFHQWNEWLPKLQKAREEIALTQHHDAV